MVFFLKKLVINQNKSKLGFELDVYLNKFDLTYYKVLVLENKNKKKQKRGS